MKQAIFVIESNLSSPLTPKSTPWLWSKNGKYLGGQGEGLHGPCYAIPTRNHKLEPLSLEEITSHVTTFIEYAKSNPKKTFMVTRIGCSLNEYTDTIMAPLFKPLHGEDNIWLPTEWDRYYKS